MCYHSPYPYFTPVNIPLNTLLLFASAAIGPALFAETRLVSNALEGPPGLSPSGSSMGAFPNESGTRILFSTSAANLAAGKSGTINFDACLMDVTNRVFTLVSTNFHGRSGGGRSIALGVRGDRALFLSDAEDLVEEDANELADIFLRDADGTIRRLGRTSPQTGANASHVTFGSFSGDGTRVVFEIAPDFSSEAEGSSGGVYLAETESGVVTQIDNSPLYGSNSSFNPLINHDGSVVVYKTYETLASRTNLADLVVARAGHPLFRPDLTPEAPSFPPRDIFRIFTSAAVLSENGRYLAFVANRDPEGRSFNVLYWMDLDNPGDIRTVQSGVFEKNSLSMSGDGRRLAFEAGPTPDLRRVMFWDADAGLESFDSLLADDPPASTEPRYSNSPVLSSDGARVLFLTDMLVTNATSVDTVSRIALRELSTGTTRFLSDLPDGTPADSLGLGEYRFMPDGNEVLISVPAPLVAGDSNQEHDLFLVPFAGGAPDLLTRRDVALSGFTGNNSSQIDERCLSADGHYLVFASSASDLVAGDTNRSRDIFLKDLRSQTLSLISIATNGAAANSSSTSPKITPDGRFVAFLSTATDLAEGDSNRRKDAYLRDLQAGTNVLLSPRLLGTFQGNVTKLEISDDGRTALMESDGGGLTSEDGHFGNRVYLRHVSSNVTVLISRTVVGTTPIHYGSGAKMSADGRTVVFISQTVSQALPVVYHVGSDTAASLLPEGGGEADQVTISRDGTRFAMQLRKPDLTADIWVGALRPFTVRRLVEGLEKPAQHLSFTPDGGRLIVAAPNGSSTNLGGIFYLSADPFGVGSGFELVSATPSGSNANGTSGQPSTSFDGRFVTFKSTASDLVPGDNGTRYNDIFVRDMLLGKTLSVTGDADERSANPVISSDGRFIVFNSFASNLTANDPNSSLDVFVADVGFPMPMNLQIGSESGSVTISFPTTAENRYRLERRGLLGSGSWTSEGEFFDGDGLERRITLPTGDSSTSFFRVVTQPRPAN
jgi:Tol biopolymer transport system component